MARTSVFSAMSLAVLLSWGAMLNFAWSEDQTRLAREASAGLASAPAETAAMPQTLAAKAEDALKPRVAQASALDERAATPQPEDTWQEPGTGTAFDAYPLSEDVLALN